MRLFYAINFEEDVRQKLMDIQDRLREQVVRGKFSLPDNLHLTLAFVGEVAPDRTGPLRQIAERFKLTPFELCFNGVGQFKRDGGDIVWVGIEANKSLTDVYNKLSGQLTNDGIDFDKRKFTPHLTLARDVRLQEDFGLSNFSNRMAPIVTTVTKISLMKSERIDGRLTYTELDS